MQINNINLFNSIKRAKQDYQAFSEMYSLDDLNHFDCCMYSQNFAFIIHQLKTRLDNPIFMNDNTLLLDVILKEINFFVRLKESIEIKRIELSKIKIAINTFIFSEN